MEKLLDLLADNYMIFAIISGVLFLALIGILMSNKKKNNIVEETETIRTDELIIKEEVPAPQIPSVPLESVVNNETKPLVEPTLDSFTSNVTEVKFEGINVEKEQNMLTIEEAPAKDNFLVIEDKPSTPEVIQSTPAVQPMANPTPSVPTDPVMNHNENFLVIEDKPATGVEINQNNNLQ